MLVDFIVEIQSFEPIEKETTMLPEEAMKWSLNTNGATNKFGVGIEIVLESTT